MEGPTLTIEASTKGVDRIIVHLDRREAEGGFDMLRRVLLALKELDRRARNEVSRPERQGGPRLQSTKKGGRHDS